MKEPDVEMTAYVASHHVMRFLMIALAVPFLAGMLSQANESTAARHR